MSKNIKEQISCLVKLQGIETDRFNINIRLEKVQGNLEDLDIKLKAFEQEVENETDIIDEIKMQYRRSESDTQENLLRVQKSRVRLGSVKNNKEYQALIKEIEELDNKNSQIEDKMLEYLDYIDETEKQIESKKKALIAFSKEVEEEKNSVIQKSEEDKRRLVELNREREETLKEIDSPLVDKYNMVKETVGRITIVRVKDSVCLGCNMNMPAQKYNELQRCDSLQFCPHCHRIIYWKNHNERSE